MTKNEFLSAVEAELVGLPKADIDRSLEFLGEMIDDKIEDGVSEAEAVAALGSPEAVAREILMEMPLPKIVRAKTLGERKLRTWEIALLIIGSPVWLPLLLAAAVVVLSVYIVIWSAVITLWAVDVALAACAPTSVFLFVILLGAGNVATGLFFLGAALALGGLSIFLFLGCREITKLSVKLGILIWKGLKSLFVGGDKK